MRKPMPEWEAKREWKDTQGRKAYKGKKGKLQ